MTKTKTTKRALLMSVLSMLLCVSMLVGSTFAWFTDTVTSGNNKIVAGNLDIELEYCVDPSMEDADWNAVEGAEDFFGDIALWEPGTTGVVYFRLSNLGTLALKYKLAMNFTDTVIGKNADDGDIKLSEVLEFGIVDGQEKTFESREAAIAAVTGAKKVNAGYTDEKSMGVTNEKTYFALVVYMPTTVGNEANYRGEAIPQIDLGVTLLATQDTVETDGFGPDYDANAEYPIVLPQGVTTETFEAANAVAYAGDTYYATLTSAVEAAEGVIYLKPGSELTETMTHAHVRSNLTIYGNGAALTGGGEHDLEVDTYSDAKRPGLVGDVTINIYNFDGIAVWGQRTTEYTVNINLYNCHDINRIYISGEKGTNNITLTNCSAGYSQDGKFVCKLYSNAKGEIRVTNCSFDRVCEPINLNNKSAGVQNIYVTNCTFTNCSTADITLTDAAWAAPIRVVAAGEGAVSNLHLKGNEFVYSEGKEAVNGCNVLTEELRESKKDEMKGTVNVIED